jgi:REP element-mobilizing transposase RayT
LQIPQNLGDLAVHKLSAIALTTRLRSWGYAADAWYFVTICTQGRTHFFGEVVNDAMQLSAIGEVAHQFWVEIPQHFAHVALDQFLIMPNHVHGILVINRDGKQLDNKTGDQSTHEPTPAVETRHVASLPPATVTPPTEAANTFGPLKKHSLQSIIHAYKSAVTRWCKKNDHPEFAWQARYCDHIIRSEESLRKIRDYIANNPLKWSLDKENQSALWM